VSDSRIDFVTGAPAPVSLDVAWMHGAPAGRRVTDPPVQVHHADPHTVILRQSKSVNYEAPFQYLLLGNDRALLLDTGATADPAKFPLRATVDQLLAEWLADHPRDSYELVVAHTHGHRDHRAGDAQFAGRAGTTIVSREPDAVQQYFGFASWPEQIVEFDLGGRVLEVTGSPPAITGPPSPSTIPGPDSCSLATPSSRAACTRSTSPSSWPASTAWSPSPTAAA
jgi:hydroxyacylglutathione hydrolase